jgi:pSer/pThr/pTyr-binding forkhead associated (FHA) protein
MYINSIIKHQSISKEHASIEFDNGEIILRDLNSSNGCYVNDRRVVESNFHKIKTGDLLKFGKGQYI